MPLTPSCPARRSALRVQTPLARLHDDRLAAAARGARGARPAGALATDGRPGLAGPGPPGPRAVPVAVDRAVGRGLAAAGTGLGADLGLHQPGDGHRHGVAQDAGMLGQRGLGDALGSGHAVPLGHRGPHSSIGLVVDRRVRGSAVADIASVRHRAPASHHFCRLNLRPASSRLLHESSWEPTPPASSRWAGRRDTLRPLRSARASAGCRCNVGVPPSVQTTCRGI